MKFYSLFWDSVLLVSFNECANRKCLTQSRSKDVDENFGGIIHKTLKVNKSQNTLVNSDK